MGRKAASCKNMAEASVGLIQLMKAIMNDGFGTFGELL